MEELELERIIETDETIVFAVKKEGAGPSGQAVIYSNRDVIFSVGFSFGFDSLKKVEKILGNAARKKWGTEWAK